jgi:hypothetical protein
VKPVSCDVPMAVARIQPGGVKGRCFSDNAPGIAMDRIGSAADRVLRVQGASSLAQECTRHLPGFPPNAAIAASEKRKRPFRRLGEDSIGQPRIPTSLSPPGGCPRAKLCGWPNRSALSSPCHSTSYAGNRIPGRAASYPVSDLASDRKHAQPRVPTCLSRSPSDGGIPSHRDFNLMGAGRPERVRMAGF